MRSTFARQVRTQGGELVASVAYPQDTTSFAKAVEELRAHRFEAVFVPDSAAKVALIAPALAAAGLWSRPAGAEPPPDGRAITILAPNVGYSEQLVANARRYLQGALFSRAFHGESATGAGREFADAFRQRYGSAPDAFAAYAYDAFRLVRRAVQQGGTDRQRLAERLGRMDGVSTAGPSRGFAPGGEPARGPRVFTLEGDRLVPVQVPAPPTSTGPRSGQLPARRLAAQ
jgi:branched-chain amino acid transport system substrate-binding protein